MLVFDSQSLTVVQSIQRFIPVGISHATISVYGNVVLVLLCIFAKLIL